MRKISKIVAQIPKKNLCHLENLEKFYENIRKIIRKFQKFYEIGKT